MHKYLLVFLGTISLMVCSLSCKSQQPSVQAKETSIETETMSAEEKVIRQTFSTYFNTVEQGDYGTTLDYIYPRLYDLVPKEAMLTAMLQINADPSIQISMDSSTINKISNVITVGDSMYARVDYSFRMIMKLIPEETGLDEEAETDTTEGEEEEEEFNQFDFTANMLDGMYGEKNVRRDKENSILYIQIEASMFAIDDPKFKGWKFLEKKDQLKPVLEQLIPEEVLKEL
jgi:hypothetical protein